MRPEEAAIEGLAPRGERGERGVALRSRQQIRHARERRRLQARTRAGELGAQAAQPRSEALGLVVSRRALQQLGVDAGCVLEPRARAQVVAEALERIGRLRVRELPFDLTFDRVHRVTAPVHHPRPLTDSARAARRG
jgi:hypothetical protein